jgi:hypothetical protein
MTRFCSAVDIECIICGKLTWVQCVRNIKREYCHSGKEARKKREQHSCILRTIIDPTRYMAIFNHPGIS